MNVMFSHVLLEVAFWYTIMSLVLISAEYIDDMLDGSDGANSFIKLIVFVVVVLAAPVMIFGNIVLSRVFGIGKYGH